MQGCGKSLAAKAIASAWGLPLLALDSGKLLAPFIGESERNLRDALRRVERMAPCVLWIDEIEKAFASSRSSESDGGVSKRLIGMLLVWMQERASRVFLVATANAVDELPPEMMRKGRVDEVFFVDLPGPDARAEIFRLHLARRSEDPTRFDLPALAKSSDGFSGRGDRTGDRVRPLRGARRPLPARHERDPRRAAVDAPPLRRPRRVHHRPAGLGGGPLRPGGLTSLSLRHSAGSQIVSYYDIFASVERARRLLDGPAGPAARRRARPSSGSSERSPPPR